MKKQFTNRSRLCGGLTIFRNDGTSPTKEKYRYNKSRELRKRQRAARRHNR